MYFGYPCEDVICNAHLLRELTFFCERDKYSWAKLMKNYLENLYLTTREMSRSGRRKRSAIEFTPIQKNVSQY